MGRPSNTDVMLRQDAEKSTALALPPELAGLFDQDAGTTNDIGKDDRSIPFINLIQSLSPEVEDSSEKFISGAKVGDFFNSVTRELFSGADGVVVIPVFYEKVYNEWVPRTAGGGFVRSYKTKEQAVRECQEGNQIVDTAIHYVLVRSERTSKFGPALLSMTSTKLKASRDWNALVDDLRLPSGKPAPCYAMTYRITSIKKKNDKGTYSVPVIAPAGWVADVEAYAMAKALRQTIEGGERKADFSREGGDSAAAIVEDGNPEF